MPRDTIIDISETPYCYESSLQPMIDETAIRVSEMRQDGALTPEVLHTIRKYFRIKNIYHSNAIEGNPLNIGETRQVVELGLTLTGMSLKDQAEAKSLSEAIDYLEELASDSSQPIREVDVRQLHHLVLKGVDDRNAGSYRSVEVEISGSDFKPPGPESIRKQMQDFGEWLQGVSIGANDVDYQTAIVNAAVAHTWLVLIHPFVDGNGRVARLLMNLVLMRYGYPIAIITKEDRLRYYDVLELSQSSDLSGFIALITECVHESLEEYEKAVDERREREEWALSIASRFSARERVKAENEYEVWKNAMELLKSYFRQTAEIVGEVSPAADTYFRDFGNLEFEKYLSLRQGESAKKTWFFRLDFRSGTVAVRYLFFFGTASWQMRTHTDVTLHIAREVPSGSFNYARLEIIDAPNVPDVTEIGYQFSSERFVKRTKTGRIVEQKIEALGRQFFEEVINKHFST